MLEKAASSFGLFVVSLIQLPRCALTVEMCAVAASCNVEAGVELSLQLCVGTFGHFAVQAELSLQLCV